MFGIQYTLLSTPLHNGNNNEFRDEVGEHLQEVEMNNGTIPDTENLGDGLGDVQHPDMRGSLDRESEDDPGLTHNGQPEMISDVRQPPTTT